MWLDWNLLTDIAQVVSAVAVVVSLLILAFEVRRAGREVVMSSQQAQANAHSEYLLALATETELVNLIGKFLSGEALSALETQQQAIYYNAMMIQFQVAYQSAQSLGEASGGNWAHSERALSRWTVNPGFVAWWDMDRDLFDERFRAIIDGKIAVSGTMVADRESNAAATLTRGK